MLQILHCLWSLQLAGNVTDKSSSVSPSVYVAFQSLYATNLCGHVGKDIPETTIGFTPGELSTALAYQYNFGGANLPPFYGNNFTVANFGNQPKNCSNVTTSFIINNVNLSTYPYGEPLPSSVVSYCGATPTGCDINSGSIVYNPCSPTLSVPSELFTLDPQWKTCSPGIGAFFDPPYTLTQGDGFSAFNGGAGPTVSPSPAAQPQVTPSAPTPSSTPVLEPSPLPDLSPPTAKSSPSANPLLDTLPLPNPTPFTDTSPLPNPTPAQISPSELAQPQPQATPGIPLITLSTAPVPFVAGTQTITPGSSAVVMSGTTYSVPASGGAVVINQSITQYIPQPERSTLVPFVAGTQTINPGAPAVVISGTTYSVPSSGGAVIINNSITQSFTQHGQTGTDLIPTYVLESQTLVAGGPGITLSSSIVVSLMSGGQSVVVEGSSTTETLAVSAAFTATEGVVNPSETGIGGIIVSIGGFTTPSSTSQSYGSSTPTALIFQGSSTTSRGATSLTAWIIGAGVAMLGILIL